MIEKKFIKQNVSEDAVKEYVINKIGRAGIGNVKMHLTPLGEKIVIFSSNPGLVVGKEGSNIKELTSSLKKNFNFENPQIEISEVENQNSNAQIVADRIAGQLERYGSKNFKGIMHKSINDVLGAGVRGVEIVLSGKIPGSRAKSWRILSGYMKKCGDVAVVDVQFAKKTARLKSGVIGIKVKIMPSDIVLPDTVKIPEEIKEEVIEEEIREKQEENEEAKEKLKEEKKTKAKKARAPSKRKKKENDKKSKTADGAEQSGTEKQAE